MSPSSVGSVVGMINGGASGFSVIFVSSASRLGADPCLIEARATNLEPSRGGLVCSSPGDPYPGSSSAPKKGEARQQSRERKLRRRLRRRLEARQQSREMEYLKGAANAVKDRYDTAMDAHKLLETGGSPVEASAELSSAT